MLRRGAGQQELGEGMRDIDVPEAQALQLGQHVLMAAASDQQVAVREGWRRLQWVASNIIDRFGGIAMLRQKGANFEAGLTAMLGERRPSSSTV